MASLPSNSPFELPSALPEDGSLFVRLLATRLDPLAAENTKLKEQVLQQAETIRELRDEIAVPKGQQGRPAMKPSRMNQETGKDDPAGGRGRDKRRHFGLPAKSARTTLLYVNPV